MFINSKLTKVLYNLKMREKIAKKGHRRQISKELIKRKLMEDLYPIPRQRQSASRNKMKSSLNIKFANTLQFLDFDKVQVLMLHKFEQKLKQQLVIPSNLLDSAFQYLKVDSNVYRLIKKLVTLHTKPQEGKDKQELMHMLRNVIPTSKPILQNMVTLLLFYHFVSINIEQYRSIIKEFQKQKILQLIDQITYPKSQLITSKILSAIFIILLKYNEVDRIIKMGPKVVKLRRNIQATQKRMNLQEHKRQTLFYNLKYIEFLMKSKSNPYQLMTYVQKQLQIAEEQENNDSAKEAIKIYKNELFKLKRNIQSQVDSDYYQNYKSEEKYVQPSKNKDKINIAIKQLKRRKSVNLFKRSISLEENSCEALLKQATKAPQVNDKNFKQVYNPSKKVQQFSKLPSESNLKKGRKIQKSTVFEQGSKTSSIAISNIKDQPAKNTIYKHKSKPRQKGQQDTTLFAKLSNLYQIAHKHNFYKEQQPTYKQKLQKKKKIQTIYENFSNLNKIVRQIPTINLQRQFYIIRELRNGHKGEIKQMMASQIINFQAGLQRGNYQISSILNNKGCLSLQFVKVWLGLFYRISLVIEVKQYQFILKVALNKQTYNIVLNRGSNLLCERYVTIWPTIRYLVNKKLYRYNIFKKYQHLLLAKKMPQANLIQLQSQMYLQKFGFISKQQIEQINICLDSVFKIILVSKHYYGNAFHPQLVKINEQVNLPCLISFRKQQGEIMKLNLLSQIYLTTNTIVVLVEFIITSSDKYFLVKIIVSRQKLINIIRNKEEIVVSMEIISLQTHRTKIQNYIKMQWIHLQQNLVIFEDFKRYTIQIFSHRPKDKHFAKQLIKFFTKRLLLKNHPIFLWQCKFIKDPIFTHRPKNQLNSQLQQTFQRHKIQTIQSYCQSQTLPINQTNFNISQQKIKQSRIFFYGIRKMKSQFKSLPKTKHKHLQKIQIWKQQKRIGNKDYLIIINMAQQRISQDWIAEFILTNRKSEAKYILTLNHLDLFNIYQNQLSVMHEESHLDKTEQQSNIKTQIRQQKKMLLSKLINSTSFFYSHHLSKICIQKDGKYYRYNYHNQIKIEKQLANRRENRNKNVLCFHPLLQNFTIYSHLRIVKPIKVGKKFGFLTFKQNLIEEQYFWEIILQFPRKQTHYAFHMKEQNMIFYISDHRKKRFKRQETPKKLDYSISIPSHSRFCDSLSLSFLSSAQQESINYKNRILTLISTGSIIVKQRGNQYVLIFFEDQYTLRQRIIHQYQLTASSLYNVWVDEDVIEVQLYRHQASMQNSHSTSSQFLNSFKQQVIGKIQFSLADRFYQMENKQLRSVNDYRRKSKKRVCQFYFEYIKQQKFKQEKLLYTKSQVSLQQSNEI